jgi:hypothetical protein
VASSGQTKDATLTVDVATESGLALIDDISASIVGGATGTGALTVTILTPGGDVILDASTASGTKSFTPTGSLHEVITADWVGGDGSASLSSLTINFSEIPAPVPEPATLVLLGTGLAGLTGIARCRTRDR